jgi:hypothetical protein
MKSSRDTKKCSWLFTLALVLALQSVPASACQVVGYANGEPQCMTTSDGPGQPYTDGRTTVSGWQWYLRHRLHRRFW